MSKIQFTNIDSKSELVERLRQYPDSILLGIQAVGNHCFLLASECDLQIGLCADISGAGYEGIIVPETQMAFIGYDCEVIVVDLISREVIRSVKFLSTFFQFLHLEPQGLVLAIHELGLVALTKNGSVKHEFYTPDIVVDWHVVGNLVFLSLYESGKLKLNLLDGTSEVV